MEAYCIISVPSTGGTLLEWQQTYFCLSHKPTRPREEKIEATKFWMPERKRMRVTDLADPIKLTAKSAVGKAKKKPYLCPRPPRGSGIGSI